MALRFLGGFCAREHLFDHLNSAVDSQAHNVRVAKASFVRKISNFLLHVRGNSKRHDDYPRWKLAIFFTHWFIQYKQVYICVNKKLVLSSREAESACMKYRRLEMSKPIPVMLDKSLLARIETMSEKVGEAKSTIMRMSMRIGLDALEKAFEAKPADVLNLISNLESKKSSSSNYPQVPGSPEEKSKLATPPTKRPKVA
jgi:hypothetical protein